MSLWDRLTSMMAAAPQDHPPVLQTRSDPPTEGSLNDFIARVQGARSLVWRTASVRDALGVPANFGAVTLISNVTGSLSMLAERNGVQLAPMDRPRLIVRPNPLGRPRDFFRETAWSMAAYGEAWWWVAARDIDGSALSLIPVHPVEITVIENERDLRYPIIKWRDRTMANEDMVQIKMTGEVGALRGKGPLQMCGAAVSVAVEAQEWAANFYSEGGNPSINLHSGAELTETEADALRTKWVATPSNTPQVTSGDLTLREVGKNAQGAQMLQARTHQDINTAQMFQIPGTLLEAVMSGSSITYQNREGLWGEFHERCLLPNYLEPIEQAMSDQLTRSTIARFNTKGLLRADIKTRFEVHKTAIESQIYGPDVAAIEEGYAPGDVENAPMPLAPPQAVPASLPIQLRTRQPEEVRCSGSILVQNRIRPCGRLLAELATPPYRFTCPRCKSTAAAA